jgi:hypothetical protein
MGIDDSFGDILQVETPVSSTIFYRRGIEAL